MRAAILLLCALLVAGCASPSASPPPVAGGAFAAVAPTVDAGETLAELEAFVAAYPFRQVGTPTMAAAQEHLASAFESAGLEVVRQDFGSGAGAGQNVIGIKWGADRERWVVVGAHYDILPSAVHGAYDDGSGTIMVLKLAEAFAGVATNRTIAFIEFDGEERGLLGSAAFVKSVVEETFVHPVTVEAMIDLDMIGINHPHPAKIVCLENSDEVRAKIEELRAAVGVPDGQVEYRASRVGSSDGVSFIAAGIPTAYCFSNWDDVVTADGQPLPRASYPFWHQADTYESMVAMAGTEETLRAGFQTVLDVMSPLALWMSSAQLTVR